MRISLYWQLDLSTCRCYYRAFPLKKARNQLHPIQSAKFHFNMQLILGKKKSLEMEMKETNLLKLVTYLYTDNVK